MNESELFSKIGEVILGANQKLLGKESPNCSDVKEYLEAVHTTDKLLVDGFDGEPKRRYVNAYARSEINLRGWNEDRSGLFFELLNNIHCAHETFREETMEANVWCCKILIEEPLIPSKRLEEYHRTLSVSSLALEKAKEEESETVPCFQAYLLGIIYNASKFCPHLFAEPTTEDELQKMKRDFLESLEVLQGKTPVVH